MEKNCETCVKCKYSIHIYCANKHCDNCEMNDKELDACKCGTIAPHQDCPYYEPAEEEK